MPAGRLRPSGAEGHCRLDRAARAADRARPPRSSPPRSPSPCCSATWPSSCTRAIPRWPSAGPPPWPWTPPCSTSCWAGWSCANCWTPKVIDATETRAAAAGPGPAGARAGGRRGPAAPAGPARPSEEVAARLQPAAAGADAGRSARTRRGAGRRRLRHAECWPRRCARGSRPTPPPIWPPCVRANRALKVNIGGAERFAAIEDAARLRDALGVPLPMGVPLAFIEPVADPLGDLSRRYARTHGPFTAAEAAARLGLGVAVVGTGAEAAGRGRPRGGRRVPARTPAASSETGAASRGGCRDAARPPPAPALPCPRRQRMVRRRGAAQAAPPFAGRAAGRGGAGGPGRLRPLPARLAARPAPAAAGAARAARAGRHHHRGRPARRRARFRPRPGSRWCWPAGSPTTSPPCWTN